MVRMFLERLDIHHNTAKENGQTTVLWSAYQEHKAVVNRLPREVGVNPDTADNDGQRQLFRAAHNGH